MKGLEPIVVIFLEKKDKEAVWLKIREEENLPLHPYLCVIELIRVVSACASSPDHLSASCLAWLEKGGIQ